MSPASTTPRELGGYGLPPLPSSNDGCPTRDVVRRGGTSTTRHGFEGTCCLPRWRSRPVPPLESEADTTRQVLLRPPHDQTQPTTINEANFGLIQTACNKIYNAKRQLTSKSGWE